MAPVRNQHPIDVRAARAARWRIKRRPALLRQVRDRDVDRLIAELEKRLRQRGTVART